MKKLAGLAAAGAMLLGMALPVLANGTVVINRGWAVQNTSADADANSGAQKGGDIEVGYDEEWDSEGDSGVGTGNATAVTGASAWANIFTTQVLSVGLLED